MQKKRQLPYLVLSVALHILCLVGIAALQIPNLEVPEKLETVQIEIKEKVLASGNGRPNGGRQRRSFALKSLVPQFSQYSNSSSQTLGSGQSDLQAGWGDGGADFERIADQQFFDGIREKVEGLLYYPPILARHNISGVVKSRLVVSGASGECDFARSKVNGGHRFLEIYTLSLLKKLCGFNLQPGLPKRQWVVMDLAFDFEISERPVDELEFKNFTVGNVLAFHRGVQKSVAEWHLGPIQGIWFLPVVNLDIGWIGEKWDSWVKGRDVYEEFREI